MKVRFQRKYRDIAANGLITDSTVEIEVDINEDLGGIMLYPKERQILAELRGNTVGDRPSDIKDDLLGEPCNGHGG